MSGGRDESGTSRDLSVGDPLGALPAPPPKLVFAPSVKPAQGAKEQLNLSRTVCIKTRRMC